MITGAARVEITYILSLKDEDLRALRRTAEERHELRGNVFLLDKRPGGVDFHTEGVSELLRTPPMPGGRHRVLYKWVLLVRW